MRSGRIGLTIESRLDQVHLVGRAVRGICSCLPMSDEEAYQFELCIVEAVNNAIEHAYANEPGHEVRVVVSIERNRLTLEVFDGGTTMDWMSVQARRSQSSLLDEGGRGFLIMESYMDQVSYDHVDGTNVLKLVKEIGEAPEDVAPR